MDTALPANVRLHFDEKEEAKMLKLMNKTGLPAAYFMNHFATVVLNALPENVDEITLPVSLNKLHRSKAQAA